MNYRHHYHAGNFADVFKHWLLTLLLKKLAEKPAPFSVLDTHAGLGLYDLTMNPAVKTMEYVNGIAKLLEVTETPKSMTGYLDLVRGLNPNKKCLFYPGSPYIIARYLRSQDHLHACELHPQDYEILANFCKQHQQCHIHCRDGYQALEALLPFKEKRGLILIDPPFEKKDEFDNLEQALQKALSKFPQGMYAIWYPIKARTAINKFHEKVAKLNVKNSLVIELLVSEEVDAASLHGCGMVILNSPWQIDETIKADLPFLRQLFAASPKAYEHIFWIKEPV